MKKIFSFSLLILFVCCTTPKEKPPVAKKEATELIEHGDKRIDPYFWMRLSDDQKEAEVADPQTRDVVAYLEAENNYTDQILAHTKTLQDTLYHEMIGRIKQDDRSVPYSVNGYQYYSRYEEGKEYRLYCRKKNEKEAPEEIMLNGPKMAEGTNYFSISGRSVSENNRYLAYGLDLVSRRNYTIHVKDLETGELLPDKIENTSGRAVWANDNKTLFYIKKDPVTLRSNKIYRHTLGTDSSQDVLVYEEKDETFGCTIYKSKSRAYLMITSYQTLSNEYQYLDAHTPTGKWTMIQPRERGLEYSVSHFGNHFYINTNHEAENFRLMKTTVTTPSKENWQELIPHRNDVLLEGIDIFERFLVVTERKNGLTHLRVIPWNSNKKEHYIEFNDPTYSTWTSINPEFKTDWLRFNYSSMTTPSVTYDYHMENKKRVVKKETEILGGKFDRENYISERLYAPSRDGKTQIPISVVYHKDFQKDGAQPLILYGYGSYGSSMDAGFSSSRLSLLDRGFAYAIAHIRGGQEMGRYWYDEGKMMNKKNTFYDFIDCGKFLIDRQFTSSEHLYALGGSAGGLLVGAVINMAPQLFHGVIAAVPFVDVVSTMMDEDIPLTTGEFDEWGNPKIEKDYHYIKSYSPYDNVEKKDYPNLLVTTGYWDSQVQYWEPAKWVAKLRAHKTDANLLLLHCDMEVGHGGASGRLKRFKETAMEYAFLLDLEQR